MPIRQCILWICAGGCNAVDGPKDKPDGGFLFCRGPYSSNSPASELMAAMGQLKNRFYDLHRGRVDYGGMKNSADYCLYQEVAARLRSFELGSLSSDEEKLAFWINIYNSIVTHGIVEMGIKLSVKEIPNFFRKISYRIGNFSFSPEAIEHGILRANACPPFGISPVFGRKNPRFGFSLKVLPEKNKIFLSQIFDWYEKDFGGKAGIRQFLLRYLDKDEKWIFMEKNRSGIRNEYLFYDWNLNH